MSSAGGSQKKRKAVVRKESADTQEYESCHQSDMDEDAGGVELRSKCGKRFGWMARTTFQLRHEIPEGRFQVPRHRVD